MKSSHRKVHGAGRTVSANSSTGTFGNGQNNHPTRTTTPCGLKVKIGTGFTACNCTTCVTARKRSY